MIVTGGDRYVSPASLGLPQSVYEYVAARGLQQSVHSNIYDIIEDTDVLYVTRVQKERFESEAEYDAVKGSYVVDTKMMSQAKVRESTRFPVH